MYSVFNLAAKNGNLKLMYILLDKSKNLNIVDNRGNTPLHVAAKAGNWEIVQLLITKGFKLIIANNKGYTALHFTAECPHNTTTCKKLVEVFCMTEENLNSRTQQGETALSLNLRKGNLEIFKLLLEIGADETLVYSNGLTLLHIC